ncbi:MAG: rod shape-determining protein MreD [Thermoleophilia bacterium]
MAKLTDTSKQVSPLLQGDGEAISPGATKEGPLFMLRVIFLVLLGVVLQITVAPHINVLGAKPDSALVFVVCIALLRGPVWGAAMGFVMGLLVDVALLQTLGISSFLFTLAGYVSGRYGEGVDTDSWVPPLITVFLCTMVVQFLNAVIMFLLGIEAAVSFILLRVVLPTAVLNALLAPPLFVVTRWWLGGDKSRAFFTE